MSRRPPPTTPRRITTAEELQEYLQGNHAPTQEADDLARERLELEREKIALRRAELELKREQAKSKQQNPRPPNKHENAERRAAWLALLAVAPVLLSLWVLLYVLITT